MGDVVQLCDKSLSGCDVAFSLFHRVGESVFACMSKELPPGRRFRTIKFFLEDLYLG